MPVLKIEASRKFLKLFQSLPAEIQSQAKKALEFLADSPNHPSLHNKKMAGYENIYEIRVSRSYRITCQKTADTAVLRKIGAHDLLHNP